MSISVMRGGESTGICRMRNASNFRLADSGDPNVIGWEVVGTKGEHIGRVDDLMVDPQVNKIRYLDVRLDRPSATAVEEHLLLPVGVVLADERQDVIKVDLIETPAIMQLPLFTGDTVTREYEEQVFNVLKASSPNTTNINREFYDHSYFDHNRFYSARRPRPGQRGHDSFLPFQTDNR